MNEYRLSDDQLEKYINTVNSNCELMKTKKDFLLSYVDPDTGIIQEYDIDGKTIRLSPDGICGIKYLLSYYDGNDYAYAYQIIRNKIILWPKHRQSINQKRFRCFRDRIDFTIFDISKFYENGESKLVAKSTDSARYLNSFGSFRAFVEEYGFELFLDEEGNVRNLAGSGIINGYHDYEFSDDINRRYLKELLMILKIGEKSLLWYNADAGIGQKV